jgi:nucleoside-diphosphate-sugar epimerase
MTRSLRRASLITGGNGFLGGLAAAALLAEEKRRILLPVRPTVAPGDCLARIRLALLDRDVPEQLADELMGLVSVVELPPLDRLRDLASSMEIDEIVHCAGCVDYFDKRRLQTANIDFTSKLLDAGREWGVRRFLYLSTAYCSGYRSGLIPEELHPDPSPHDEPTEYTRSKRIAEWLIADSGIRFLILRLPIVIGDSRTGKYTGKNYGLYQMWRAIEGLLCREYCPVWHTVAPPIALDFVHQNAFQTALIGIYRNIYTDAIVHLVGDAGKAPTMRELCWLWAGVYSPLEIHAYGRVDDVPLQSIPVRQRRFLEIAAKNLEICTQTWKFSTGYMDKLRFAGLPFVDATLDTVLRCQLRYIHGSARIQEHMRQYAGRTDKPPQFIDMLPCPLSSPQLVPPQ